MNYFQYYLQSKIGPFPALAKENNLSGLKKRGLYAHLLKTELSSSPEGSNLGGGQSISGGIGIGSRQGKPGYRVQLKQLKSLRKKDDIIYERDTYVPLKSKGNKATIFTSRAAARSKVGFVLPGEEGDVCQKKGTFAFGCMLS